MIDVILALGREWKKDRSGGGRTEKGQMVKEAQNRVVWKWLMRNTDPDIKVGKMLMMMMMISVLPSFLTMRFIKSLFHA